MKYGAQEAHRDMEKLQKESHTTQDGYCCACEYDIAGFEEKLAKAQRNIVVVHETGLGEGFESGVKAALKALPADWHAGDEFYNQGFNNARKESRTNIEKLLQDKK